MDDGKGTSEDNINKFRTFLDYVLESEKVLFSVRNDGSIHILKRHFSTSRLDKVHIVPDGGFFIKTKNFQHIECIDDNINIGINIAGDMENIRFGNDYVKFCQRFANYINSILSTDKKINIVFLPHMYKI